MLNGKIFMGKNSEQWILLGFESIIYGECCKIHQWSTGNPISEQQHLTGTCLVAELCLTLCNPMNCSTPVFPVLHYLPEFAQTHIHWISDTIQPSHPLSSPSPPAFNLSQHQSFFLRVSSSHQVAKILELQYEFFWWMFTVNFLPGGSDGRELV